MEGYRLRSAHGDTIDQTQPLPVDTVEAQETVSVAPTLTYNGKAAAGAISISSVALKPIIEAYGGRVGSFWGRPQNKVYEAFADGVKKNKSLSNLRSVTETATAAAFVVYDPDKNLEELFESLTGTVKRFIAKVTDKSGGSLYGWIMGVSVSSGVYTFTVHNHRVSETQSWVGTLSAFDNTALEKVEIFYYNSSISFGTGTTFTEEVECPKEYSKSRESQLIFAETLANGQYFVDYMRGELIGVKADTTASEVVTYNIWSSTSGGSTSAPSTNINVAKVGGTAVTLGQKTAAASIPVTLPSDATGFATTVADGGSVTLGAKADAKSTATDATPVTAMQVLKEISYMEQNPALGKAEDAVHSSGDLGVQVLAVRKDTVGALAADGDYVPLLQDASGNMKVNPTSSIIGPAIPVIDSYVNAAISAAANTANQSLIAAPGANKQIWVYGINFTLDTAAGSASFQDEDDTAISGVMAFAANGGMAVSPSGNFSMPLWKVATNKALEVDTVTCGIKGSIQYAIVSV